VDRNQRYTSSGSPGDKSDVGTASGRRMCVYHALSMPLMDREGGLERNREPVTGSFDLVREERQGYIRKGSKVITTSHGQPF
jgi:hypothetical protein